ncbi:hypothetical protein KKE78_02605, partial [Patescibacteria group bacterium]|nr:hypothetical protein [Patescibacteria group bacterium]
MMSIDWLQFFVIVPTIFANIFLGTLVLVKNPKFLVNRIFFSIGLVFGIWAFCLLLYEFPVIFSNVFWIKATYLSAAALEILVLAFSFVFPQPCFKKARIWAVIYSAFFFLLTIWLLYFTESWIIDVVIDPKKGLQTILGQGYIIWTIAIWVELGWAIINFTLNIRRFSGINKIQLLYLMLGFALYGVTVTVADVIIPFAKHDTSFFTLSIAGSLFFTITVTYIIIKQRFMDIRMVIARSITYMFLILILGTFYTVGLFLASTYLIKQETNNTNLFISTLLALFMAFTFQPLKRALEKFTDKIFFRGIYNSNELLAKIGAIMSTNIELMPLTAQILQALIDQMRISKGAFVILGEGLASIYDVIDLGFPHKLIVSYSQLSTFFPFPQIIVFDELEEGSLKSLMRQMDISVVKTLKVENGMAGLLFLGEKASGEIYSDQDLKVLEILAPEMAVAIQNSKSYDKIKKFNIILSEEVKKATADLQEANTRLRTIDKLKDDFVSVASHELRTPMTAIRSYAWMALHRSDVPISPNMKKYLARILISTERLINLVNDMLNVSRIESGSISIKPEPVDVLSLIRDIVDEVYY